MKSLLPAWPFMISEESFNCSYICTQFKIRNRDEHWFNLRLLYSLLIAADRMEAVGITVCQQKIPGFSQPGCLVVLKN